MSDGRRATGSAALQGEDQTERTRPCGWQAVSELPSPSPSTILRRDGELETQAVGDGVGGSPSGVEHTPC